MTTVDNAPPIHNAEAERVLLGFVLTRPDTAAELVSQVPADAFYIPAHEAVWNAITELLAAGTTPDHLAVTSQLHSRGALGKIGGANLLLDLRNAADLAATPDSALAQVNRTATLRTLDAGLHATRMRLKSNPDGDLTELLEQAVDTLDTALRSAYGSPSIGTTAKASRALEFSSTRDIRERLAQAGPRRYLIRGIWPAGSYGVQAGGEKVQKTWNSTDLALSVASGTPWLGKFPIDDPGPVLIFAGEGGEADVLRRLDAIALHRDIKVDDHPIDVCTRAPHLSNKAHMLEFRRKLTTQRPRLVIIDPLYLSAKGADLKDLYGMGALLEEAQHACSDVGAALWVNHHHNRSRDAKGAQRMSGAGPAEWGRVLINSKIVSRHTDPTTKETRVLTELEVIGGSIADDTFRVFRKIRADDPDDLDSILHYDVEVLTTTEDAYDSSPQPGTESTTLTPAQNKLLEALRHQQTPATGKVLVDWIADKYGHGLTRETVSKSLNELAKSEAVDFLEDTQGGGRWPQKLWFLPTDPDTTQEPECLPM